MIITNIFFNFGYKIKLNVWILQILNYNLTFRNVWSIIILNLIEEISLT
nr:MAG TPA: hypothetical protein [Caudoviricetes sp.]